jgi:hypothetical protein
MIDDLKDAIVSKKQSLVEFIYSAERGETSKYEPDAPLSSHRPVGVSKETPYYYTIAPPGTYVFLFTPFPFPVGLMFPFPFPFSATTIAISKETQTGSRTDPRGHLRQTRLGVRQPLRSEV